MNFFVPDSLFGQSGIDYYAIFLYLFSVLGLFLAIGLILYFTTKRTARRLVQEEFQKLEKARNKETLGHSDQE